MEKKYIDTVLYELKCTFNEFLYPLSKLQWKECRTQKEILTTDGMTCFYHPELVARYGKKELQHVILHIMMHGLLGHFQIKDDYKNKFCRDVIMDVQVEYLIAEMMKVSYFQGKKEFDSLLEGDYSMGQYYALTKSKKLATNRGYYGKLCKVDPHEVWDAKQDSAGKQAVMMFWQDILNVMFGECMQDGATECGTGETMGEKLLRQVKHLLSKQSEDGVKECFAVGKTAVRDYRELLQEFLNVKEVVREEPDSIDTMLYRYGLELYRDMPLIEPLEHSERPKVQTLAIAVDVSGSCVSDNIMKQFWGETFQCISQLKEQHAEGEVVLMQCDDRIRREEKLELGDFTEIPGKMQICGYGGTDFVPVFERLEEMEKQGTKIDALIYLTDGEGRYPKKKPDYPVYFVLPEFYEEYEQYCNVPEWIEKVRCRVVE